MKENKISWVNAAKFIAILAVLTDHTNRVLYVNQNIATASYFSVSLFIILSGMTIYLSVQRHQMGWFQTFLHLSKKIVGMYCISVFVYQIVAYKYFDFLIYIKGLISFSGPCYFVLLYLQLALVAKAMYCMVNYVENFRGGGSILCAAIVLISYFTMNYTNILGIYGGGGKLLGGTYLILFYLGMVVMKYYRGGDISLKKTIFISIISITLAILWWRFECGDRFAIDGKLPFGNGFNPPSITSMTMACIMLCVSYGIFTLCGQCVYTAWITRSISWLGGHTMSIFLYHRLFLDYMLKPYVVIENIWIRRLVYFFVMIAGSIVIEFLIGHIIKSSKRIAEYNEVNFGRKQQEE